MVRNRTYYSMAVLLVIVSGIASRHYLFFPVFLNKYPEDALCALIIFLGFGFLLPNHKTLDCALYA